MVDQVYHHQRTLMRAGGHPWGNNKAQENVGRRTNEKSLYESVILYLLQAITRTIAYGVKDKQFKRKMHGFDEREHRAQQ